MQSVVQTTGYMPDRSIAKALVQIVVLAFVIALSTAPVFAAGNVLKEEPKLAEVDLNGKRLFSIEASLGPISAEERAKNIEQIIESAMNSPDFVPGLIQAVDQKTHSDIVSGRVKIMTVTEGFSVKNPLSHFSNLSKL